MVPAPVKTTSFPTSIGIMAIAWAGSEIRGIFLPASNARALLNLIRLRFGVPKARFQKDAPSFVKKLAAQIQKHLDGKPQRYSVTRISLPKPDTFTGRVYRQSLKIPHGTVLTYQDLAERAGNSKAARAVGQAMAKNLFPIVIPCHRVIGSGKNKGGFSAHGGLSTKMKILAAEKFGEIP